MSASEEVRASMRTLVAGTGSAFPRHFSPQTNTKKLCYAFAVDACPSEMLYGTKFSLGRCKWSHDEFLKNNVPSSELSRVELRALRVIESALEKLDRLEREHRKDFNYHANLQLVKGEYDALLKGREAQYREEIDALLQEARYFGEHEQIDEALKIMENVQRTQKRLQAVILRIKRRHENSVRKNTLLKLVVSVCDQCGIAFGLDNTANRLQAHLDGKLHKSVCVLRRTAADLRAKYSVNVQRNSGGETAAKEMRPGLVSTLREDFERDNSDA